MAKPEDEPTRLALASAVLKGSLFRLPILRSTRERFLAVAPEIGLEMDLIVRFCRQMERRETVFQAGQFVLFLVGVLLVYTQQCAFGATGVALLSLLMYSVKRYHERYHILPRLWQETFDVREFARDVVPRCDVRDGDGASMPNQNVVVYSGFSPFVGSGANLGSRFFVVDLTRRTPGGASSSRREFDLSKCHKAVETAVQSAYSKKLVVQDTLFIDGSRVPTDGDIQAHRFARPNQRISPTTLSGFGRDTLPGIRTYKWVRVHDWADDLILSFFFRAIADGDLLLLEFHHQVLLPVAQRYRTIDRIPRSGFAAGVRFWGTTALAWPFNVIVSLGVVCWKANEAEWCEKHDRSQRRQIEMGLFDYGADRSWRERMASKRYAHYFQKIDKELSGRAVEKRILDGILDYLGGCGVDTSGLDERQNMILNHGIMVQGGDVNFKSLAIGTRAITSIGRAWRKSGHDGGDGLPT